MDSLQQRLIGELIGLARATDGNEHLITADSTALVLACLAARPADEDQLQSHLRRVEEIKRSMIPDCFLCANPCGRTGPYNLAQLRREPEDIRQAKQRILEALLQANGQTTEAALYQGLIAIGMEGLTPDFLDSLAREIAG